MHAEARSYLLLILPSSASFERVLDTAHGVLSLAFGLIDLAFGLELCIA